MLIVYQISNISFLPDFSTDSTRDYSYGVDTWCDNSDNDITDEYM